MDSREQTHMRVKFSGELRKKMSSGIEVNNVKFVTLKECILKMDGDVYQIAVELRFFGTAKKVL